MTDSALSRRRFLGTISTAAAAIALASKISRGADAPTGGRKLGVALVGLGYYSTHELAPALLRTQFCKLAGVVTGDPAKGAKWAEQYGFPTSSIYGYDTMARMADNPAIDIVYVVTPNGLHAEHCIAAAKAGKHVICEKPMANTVADCDAIIAACKKAGVRLSVGYRVHFDPFHAELRRLARTKEFGLFMKMNGKFAFRMGTQQWRADKKLAGGGPLMDLGVYLIQESIMGANEVSPIAVTARELPKKRPEFFRDVEETIEFALEFPAGERSDCYTSYNDSYDQFRADAKDGWFEISPAFGYRGLKAATSRGPVEVTPPNQQALQMDDFAQCVLTGRPSIVSGEMGRRDLVVIEAIYASAASGKRTDIKV
jgi:glucose-fructose oxidoreductase